ncbi:hypothetical protein [Cohnella sp.]|uniref:hypothetical protein n=1 Tax=Cohnella sp. TaxID=1883426 RepID=UPI0035616FEF
MEKIKLTEPVTHHMPKKEIHPVANKQHVPVAQPVAKKVSKGHCESHMHRYVEIQSVDGFCYDGIVEHVDEEWICIAVPGPVDEMRGFFPYPPLYPSYGPYYPYRPRRFNRLILPLASLIALSLLPYYW